MSKLKTFIIALAIALFLFYIRPAHADFFLYPTKKVRTMVVCSKAVNCNAAMSIFNRASKHIKEVLNLEFELKAIVMLPEEMTGDPTTRMQKWLLRTEKLREQYDIGTTLVFLSPFPTGTGNIDFNAEDVYGMAALASAGTRDALAWMRMTGNTEIDYRITCHEMGHLMGGTHTNGEGFMSFAMQQLEHTDKYSAKSLAKMQAYIAKLP